MDSKMYITELVAQNRKLEQTIKKLQAENGRLQSEINEYRKNFGNITAGADWKTRYPVLMERIYEFDFSTRLAVALRCADVEYIWQAVRMNKNELLRVRGCGKVAVKELEDFLVSYGLHLGMDFGIDEKTVVEWKKKNISEG